jgi:uncharacterized protein (DUF1330 family)
MPAYMIARTTINDRGKFDQEFLPAIRQVFEAYGCKLLAQSDSVETIKGNDTIAHAAILEFQDLAHAHACAASPEFQAAMAIADTCMTDHAVWLVDGLAAPAETKSPEPASEAEKEPAE